MSEPYQHVIHRYPRKARVVRALLLKDQRFRGICEEYEAACNAVETWSRSHGGDAKLRAAEFEKISRELELEIERAID